MALISTILTSFNNLEGLKWAVDSVKDQKFEDWQLIIGENSSEEGQRNAIRLYCENLKKEDSRIVYFERNFTEEERKNCTPYAVVINEAYKLVSGKYMSYMCDDDFFLPTHYDKLREILDKGEYSIAYTGQFILNKNELEIYKKTGKLEKISGHLPAVLLRRCLYFTVDHNCVMHKKELFEEVGGWETRKEVRRWGDAEFWYRLGKAGYEQYPTGYYTTVKVINPKGLNIHG